MRRPLHKTPQDIFPLRQTVFWYIPLFVSLQFCPPAARRPHSRRARGGRTTQVRTPAANYDEIVRMNPLSVAARSFVAARLEPRRPWLEELQSMCLPVSRLRKLILEENAERITVQCACSCECCTSLVNGMTCVNFRGIKSVSWWSNNCHM